MWDYEAEQTALGRFGWKANQPSLRQQTAAAFLGDIGATTSHVPGGELPGGAEAVPGRAVGEQVRRPRRLHREHYRPEVMPSRLTNITLYLQALAVPARRNVNDPEVKRGERSVRSSASAAPATCPQLKTGAKTAIAGRGRIS